MRQNIKKIFEMAGIALGGTALATCVAVGVGTHYIAEEEQRLADEMAVENAAYNAKHPFPQCEDNELLDIEYCLNDLRYNLYDLYDITIDLLHDDHSRYSLETDCSPMLGANILEPDQSINEIFKCLTTIENYSTLAIYDTSDLQKNVPIIRKNAETIRNVIDFPNSI